MKENSLVERIPLWHFDGDLAVFADGSLGAGFALQGVDISCASCDFVNEVAAQLENMLKGMSDGMRLQVLYRLTPSDHGVIAKHGATSRDAGPGHRELREKRLQHLKKMPLLTPEIYLFMRSRPHGKRFAAICEEEYGHNRDRFLREVRSIVSALSHIRLGVQTLSCKQWFALCYEHLNLARSQKLPTPVLRETEGPYSPCLASQFVLSDVCDGRQIEIDGLYFRCITLQMLPEETRAAMVEAIKLPFNFWLSQSIEILDQQRELEKLQLSRRIASAMAHGAKNVADLESESKLSALEEIIGEVIDGQEKIVKTDLNITIWAQDKQALDDKSDEVLRAYREMGQAEGLIEYHAGLDAFLCALPGLCEGIRGKKVKTSNCAHLMPVYGHWPGNKNPVCLLPTREDALCALDPFDRGLENFNALIFGGSGVGKSFTILQLMAMVAAQKPGPKIIWIDNGASSRRLLNVLGGQFIDLNLESNLCLNPFDGKPTPSKIKLLLATIEIMLKDGDGLPKLHKSLLEEAIYCTYEKENPTLSDLREILATDKDLAKYAQILYSWTGDRPYGHLLDGPSNIDLTNNLVTIEIKGLDDYPDLQQVMLLILTDFIKQSANKTLLIIDEAWRLFAGPGQAFAIEAYRTFRKYGSGIWCISQNYRDFLSDNIADTLMPNTASIFMLAQRGIDWQDLQKRLQLNDSALEMAKSLEIRKGEYSELLFLQGENQSILRIAPDALAYWVATSDANDKAKIEQMARKWPDLSTMEVLQKLVASLGK